MFYKGDTVQDIYTKELFIVKKVYWQDYAGQRDLTVEFEPTKKDLTPWNKGSNLKLVKKAS